MQRRLILRLSIFAGLIAPLRAFAAPPPDVWKTISDAAEALADDDASGFLDQFDRTTPGYAALRGNVEALLNATQVSSAIEPVSDDGDDRKRTLELDWVLTISEKNTTGGQKGARRAVLKCRVERRGKRWKIVALDPVDFFRP